ncbi:MAG: phosphomannomutase/phosphoglucomutase, partial [Bdellovibrionota bacterium]
TAMREANGLCAGELSGHYYFRDNFYAENSDLALVLLLNLLARQDRPLSQVVAPYRRYFPSGEINMEVHDKDGAIERVAKAYASGTQIRLDGLTVEYPDWWFNIRPSNTEPLLRLNLESTVSAADMARRRDEIVAMATK